MKKFLTIAIILVVLLLAGFWWWYVLKAPSAPTPSATELDQLLNESPIPFPPQAAREPVRIPASDATTPGFSIPATFTVDTHSFGADQASTVVEITMLPLDLQGATVEGIGFAFSTQPPFPRPWSAYLQGSMKESNWICNVSEEGTDYVCEGTSPLPLNQPAILQLLFRSQELAPPAVPPALTLRLLQYGQTLASVVATKK